MRFRALETFTCEETRSTYVKGFLYTVRRGNDLLAALAQDWLEQGKVEYIDDLTIPQNLIGGDGVIKET